MLDLSLDSDYSVHLDGKNDLATVDSLDEFEQAISIAITEYLHSSVVGDVGFQTNKQKIRLEVIRVARNMDKMDDVQSVNVTKTDEPNTYSVRVVYESDYVFESKFSE